MEGSVDVVVHVDDDCYGLTCSLEGAVIGEERDSPTAAADQTPLPPLPPSPLVDGVSGDTMQSHTDAMEIEEEPNELEMMVTSPPPPSSPHLPFHSG